MSQTIQYYVDNVAACHEMPDARDLVLPGVRWGDHWALFTPAYWLSQLLMNGLDQSASSYYKSRGSLNEEIVFCMLGGHGVTAEMATAAFERCCDAGLVARLESSLDKWIQVLEAPLEINGRLRRYRYPNQKARFLSGAMAYLQSHSIITDNGKQLRDQLLNISGVGPKTAGWITRNYLDTDEVAILDVHIIRAGLLCDLFSTADRVDRDYFAMESRFVEFCRAMGARPAVLDCLIWDQMRTLGQLALNALKEKNGVTASTPFEIPSSTTQMSMMLTR